MRVNMGCEEAPGEFSGLQVGGRTTPGRCPANKVEPIGMAGDTAMGFLPVHCSVVGSDYSCLVGKFRAKGFRVGVGCRSDIVFERY